MNMLEQELKRSESDRFYTGWYRKIPEIVKNYNIVAIHDPNVIKLMISYDEEGIITNVKDITNDVPLDRFFIVKSEYPGNTVISIKHFEDEISTHAFANFHNNGQLHSISDMFKFDKEGRLIQYGYDDELVTYYKYNEYGNIANIKDVESGKVLWEHEFDNYGNIISANSEYYNTHVVIEYNPNFTIKYCKEHMSDCVTTEEYYDEEGIIIKRCVRNYNEEKEITVYFQNGKRINEEINKI